MTLPTIADLGAKLDTIIARVSGAATLQKELDAANAQVTELTSELAAAKAAAGVASDADIQTLLAKIDTLDEASAALVGGGSSSTAPATVAADLGDTVDVSTLGSAIYDAAISAGMPPIAQGAQPLYGSDGQPTVGRTTAQTPLQAGFFYPKKANASGGDDTFDTPDLAPAWGNLGNTYRTALPNGDMIATMSDADKVIAYDANAKAIVLRCRPLNDNDRKTLSHECQNAGDTHAAGALFTYPTVYAAGTYAECDLMATCGTDSETAFWLAAAPYGDAEIDMELLGGHPDRIHCTVHCTGWSGASNPNDPSISPSFVYTHTERLDLASHTWGMHWRTDGRVDFYLDHKRIGSLTIPAGQALPQYMYGRVDNMLYQPNGWVAQDAGGTFPDQTNGGAVTVYGLRAFKTA